MPDSLHIVRLHAVELMHWNQLLDSSHQPQSTSPCLRVLRVCGSWWWWIGDCFSASYTSNTEQPSLSVHSFHCLHPSVSTRLGQWWWGDSLTLLLMGERIFEHLGWAWLMSGPSQSSGTSPGNPPTSQSLPSSLTPFAQPHLPDLKPSWGLATCLKNSLTCWGTAAGSPVSSCGRVVGVWPKHSSLMFPPTLCLSAEWAAPLDTAATPELHLPARPRSGSSWGWRREVWELELLLGPLLIPPNPLPDYSKGSDLWKKLRHWMTVQRHFTKKTNQNKRT